MDDVENYNLDDAIPTEIKKAKLTQEVRNFKVLPAVDAASMNKRKRTHDDCEAENYGKDDTSSNETKKTKLMLDENTPMVKAMPVVESVIKMETPKVVYIKPVIDYNSKEDQVDYEWWDDDE